MKLRNFKIGGTALLVAIILVMTVWSFGGEEILAARPILFYGAKGENVKTVQSKLSQWGYYKGKVDGVFGASTLSAVKSFQKKNGLSADGIVGSSTWNALGYGAQTASATSSKSSNVELLARIVAAEAQGEPYSGQVAVAAVMLNRMKSSQFPSTLSGVAFQTNALESVSNGLIWRRTPSETAYKAAIDALNGYDPTYGALFFWNPSKPVNSWIWSRKIIVKIGNHVFAK